MRGFTHWLCRLAANDAFGHQGGWDVTVPRVELKMSPQQNAAVLRSERRSALAPRPFSTAGSRPLLRLAVARRDAFAPDAALSPRQAPAGAIGAAAACPWKRAFDVIASATLLIGLAPFLLLIAALVRLDSPGPVFFLQERTGLGGQRFKIMKFRTMRVMENGADVVQARVNDHRVTRLGALLRRTSLDELPQFWNVLRGEMSLIGPRPHAIAHDLHYGALLGAYAERFRVRPGMSGLAQVNGSRGPTETLDKMERRVRYDVAYVENWSWRMEVRVLFATARVLFAGDAF
jgi:lipopolysaccharide/colanic/teichoic acid biosynthesis glycosyltransferase